MTETLWTLHGGMFCSRKPRADLSVRADAKMWRWELIELLDDGGAVRKSGREASVASAQHAAERAYTDYFFGGEQIWQQTKAGHYAELGRGFARVWRSGRSYKFRVEVNRHGVLHGEGQSVLLTKAAAEAALRAFQLR